MDHILRLRYHEVDMTNPLTILIATGAATLAAAAAAFLKDTVVDLPTVITIVGTAAGLVGSGVFWLSNKFNKIENRAGAEHKAREALREELLSRLSGIENIIARLPCSECEGHHHRKR